MTLPELPFKIPAIELPFTVDILSHPPVVHLALALPVIVLLIELVNLIAKNRTLSITSLLLLLLASLGAVAAYITGGIDGKEAYPLLSEAGQAELKAHKLLGTYLMLMSGVVIVFKVLSMLIGKVTMKVLYLLVFGLFVAGLVEQGHDGGELVYEHGANVQRVQALDDEMFDLQEELEELKAEKKEEADEEEGAPENTVTEEKEEAAPETEESKPVKEASPAPAQAEAEPEAPKAVGEATAEPVTAPASTHLEEKAKTETAPEAVAEETKEEAVAPVEHAAETVKSEVEHIKEDTEEVTDLVTTPHLMPH